MPFDELIITCQDIVRRERRYRRKTLEAPALHIRNPPPSHLLYLRWLLPHAVFSHHFWGYPGWRHVELVIFPRFMIKAVQDRCRIQLGLTTCYMYRNCFITFPVAPDAPVPVYDDERGHSAFNGHCGKTLNKPDWRLPPVTITDIFMRRLHENYASYTEAAPKKKGGRRACCFPV